jgi:hypothetical protein
LTVEKNEEMPENYTFMMDYEYQEKKEGNLRPEIDSVVLEIYRIY